METWRVNNLTNSSKAEVATEGSFEATAQLNQARAARSRKEAEWEKRQLELMLEAGTVELESNRVRIQSIESELTAAQAETQMRRELEAVLRARVQQQKQQLEQKDSIIERLQAEINQLVEAVPARS